MAVEVLLEKEMRSLVMVTAQPVLPSG